MKALDAVHVTDLEVTLMIRGASFVARLAAQYGHSARGKLRLMRSKEEHQE